MRLEKAGEERDTKQREIYEAPVKRYEESIHDMNFRVP